MKRLVIPSAVLALASQLLLPGTLPAHASCAPPPPLAVEVSEAPLIVTGTVTELIVRPPLDPDSPDAVVHTSHFVMRIEEYLKGAGPESLEIFEPGLAFSFTETGEVLTQVTSVAFFATESVGKRYLLFARSTADSLGIPSCGHSRELGVLPSDQDLLTEIRGLLSSATQLPPTGGLPDARNSDRLSDRFAITLAGSLAFAALASSAYLLRRHFAGRP